MQSSQQTPGKRSRHPFAADNPSVLPDTYATANLGRVLLQAPNLNRQGGPTLPLAQFRLTSVLLVFSLLLFPPQFTPSSVQFKGEISDVAPRKHQKRH